MYILGRVSALHAGWGHVPYNRTFGAPTYGLKKFVTKMPTASLNPRLIARHANKIGV